jgi:hypothetical protein
VTDVHADLRPVGPVGTEETTTSGAGAGLRAGVVAVLPAAGPALLAACSSCLGLGAASVAGATTGAALSGGGVLFALAVLAVALFVQLRRSRLTGLGWRQRLLPVLVTLVAAAATFALVQWLVLPALSAGAASSGPVLP